jgi:hypothetical protein
VLTAPVLTASVLTASAIAIAGAALAGRLILPGHGFTLAHGYASLTSATDSRAAVGAVLCLMLVALLSLEVAAAARDTAAAIGLVLGVLYLFPLAADAGRTRTENPRRLTDFRPEHDRSCSGRNERLPLSAASGVGRQPVPCGPV